MVYYNFDTTFVVEVRSKQHLDQPLMELKELVLMNHSPLGGVLRYRGSLCVPNVDDMRNRILNEAHGSCYSIQLGSTKIYHTIGDSFGGKV